MKNNLLILILLIAASCNLQAMDLDRASAAAAGAAGAGAEQQQEQQICNRPECENKASKQCAECGVFYCSRECLRDDWGRHKANCAHIKSITNPDTPFVQPQHGTVPTNQENNRTIAECLKMHEAHSEDIKNGKVVCAKEEKDQYLQLARMISGMISGMSNNTAHLPQAFDRLVQDSGQDLEQILSNPQDLEQMLSSPEKIKSLSRTCAQCGKSDTKSKCSNCKAISYCNAQCQRAHWPTHKAICKKTTTKTTSKR